MHAIFFVTSYSPLFSHPSRLCILIKIAWSSEHPQWFQNMTEKLLGILIFFVCTAACVNQSVTRRLKFSTDVQFRFVQEEHAGGYCSCWGISDLAIVHNGTTYSINARYVHCRLSYMQGHVCLKQQVKLHMHGFVMKCRTHSLTSKQQFGTAGTQLKLIPISESLTYSLKTIYSSWVFFHSPLGWS